MPSACLRHTLIPNTTPLFLDYSYQWDRTAPFYRHNPWKSESWQAAAAELHYPPSQRRAVADVLHRQNGESRALELFARPDTVAVVTGQQVGLFSGPCYTIYKALTAARLAEHLNAQGMPAVAVFWLATEDHDFDEVNHCWTFDAAQSPRRLSIQQSLNGARPVGGWMGDYPVDLFKQSIAGLPFADDVSATVEQSYRTGRPLGEAFRDLLARLLPSRHLLFLDPMDPAIRSLAAGVLREALRQGEALNERLLERNRELEQAGYHAQVHVEAKTSMVFLLEDSRRIALRREGGAYVAPQRRYTAAELAERAGSLSPNALLRPVVQDTLLPTVALIGGPAEISYLAQTQVLYEGLGRPMPVIVPRSGFTLLDSCAAKILDRYQLSVKDAFDDFDSFRQRMAYRVAPRAVTEQFSATRGVIERSLDDLSKTVTDFDPTLGAALAKSRAKILYQLSKIEAKIAREALRRDERASADGRLLHSLVFPEKHLQERLYTILPFLARHGAGLLDTIYENVHLDCPDHIVLTV